MDGSRVLIEPLDASTFSAPGPEALSSLLLSAAEGVKITVDGATVYHASAVDGLQLWAYPGVMLEGALSEPVSVYEQVYPISRQGYLHPGLSENRRLMWSGRLPSFVPTDLAPASGTEIWARPDGGVWTFVDSMGARGVTESVTVSGECGGSLRVESSVAFDSLQLLTTWVRHEATGSTARLCTSGSVEMVLDGLPSGRFTLEVAPDCFVEESSPKIGVETFEVACNETASIEPDLIGPREKTSYLSGKLRIVGPELLDGIVDTRSITITAQSSDPFSRDWVGDTNSFRAGLNLGPGADTIAFELGPVPSGEGFLEVAALNFRQDVDLSAGPNDLGLIEINLGRLIVDVKDSGGAEVESPQITARSIGGNWTGSYIPIRFMREEGVYQILAPAGELELTARASGGLRASVRHSLLVGWDRITLELAQPPSLRLKLVCDNEAIALPLSWWADLRAEGELNLLGCNFASVTVDPESNERSWAAFSEGVLSFPEGGAGSIVFGKSADYSGLSQVDVTVYDGQMKDVVYRLDRVTR